MLLYNLGVRIYGLSIRAAALRNSKAARWVKGRREWRRQYINAVQGWGPGRIWVHCASYGEFEQGRPLIEGLRRKHPEHRLLLTFFSPSGYEPFKGWQGADAVLYLPLDTRRNARDLIGIVKPSAVIFIKYEFWLNYLTAIRSAEIPCYLVSAVFKDHHPFFKWYGHIFRKSLQTFTTLFIQDEHSGQLLGSIGISRFKVTGDTRFDRVLQIRNEQRRLPWLESFKGDQPLVVAGSTWADDELLVLQSFAALRTDARLLLVPHDVDDRSLAGTIERLEKSGIVFSVFSKGVSENSRVMLLDTMGMLASSYAYADVAYIGGGFAGGLHNSLEAAVFGVPVTFYGSDYTRFNEAVELLSIGAAVNVKDAGDLTMAWESLLEPERKEGVRRSLAQYFSRDANPTEAILSSMKI